MSVKKEAYLCLSAMLRARENRLLSGDRAVRMIEADSFDDAARLLSECGYPDFSGSRTQEIDRDLSVHRAEIFGEMERLAPESLYVDAFRMKYDYHNAKAVIKACAMETDASHLLSRSGRFDPERLSADITDEKLSDYPPVFADAVLNAKSTLAKTSNPQTADLILDSAYFTELTGFAEASENSFFTGYVRLLSDAANLKSAVRTMRMGKSEVFMEHVLVPGGSVDRDRILAVKDGEELASLFSAGKLAAAAEPAAAAVSGSGMTAFEKACDNAVNAYLRQAGLISYGPETLVAYLASVENEITAARMILTGKLSGVDGAVIRERLRELNA